KLELCVIKAARSMKNFVAFFLKVYFSSACPFKRKFLALQFLPYSTEIFSTYL
ncbi:hypothetical protein L9F63_012562, partial [Diploptera punctata]